MADPYSSELLTLSLSSLGTKIKTDVALCDLDTHQPVTDKLRFIYIQLPLFTKEEGECTDILDYWLYNIKNMEHMNSIAFAQQHRIFKRLESVTNYANLTQAQRDAYDEDLKIYRDFQNCMDFSIEKGRADEKIAIAGNLIKLGMSDEHISAATGLDVEQVSSLRNP